MPWRRIARIFRTNYACIVWTNKQFLDDFGVQGRAVMYTVGERRRWKEPHPQELVSREELESNEKAPRERSSSPRVPRKEKVAWWGLLLNEVAVEVMGYLNRQALVVRIIL